MARRDRTNAVPLFLTAALAYGANCALGASVAAKIVDTSGFRWLHHALYVATCASAAASASAVWWGRPRRQSRRAARALMPAAVPLAAIAWAGTRGIRHPLIALAAAPFFVASLICSLQPADRT